VFHKLKQAGLLIPFDPAVGGYIRQYLLEKYSELQKEQWHTFYLPFSVAWIQAQLDNGAARQPRNAALSSSFSRSSFLRFGSRAPMLARSASALPPLLKSLAALHPLDLELQPSMPARSHAESVVLIGFIGGTSDSELSAIRAMATSDGNTIVPAAALSSIFVRRSPQKIYCAYDRHAQGKSVICLPDLASS